MKYNRKFALLNMIASYQTRQGCVKTIKRHNPQKSPGTLAGWAKSETIFFYSERFGRNATKHELT